MRIHINCSLVVERACLSSTSSPYKWLPLVLSLQKNIRNHKVISGQTMTRTQNPQWYPRQCPSDDGVLPPLWCGRAGSLCAGAFFQLNYPTCASLHRNFCVCLLKTNRLFWYISLCSRIWRSESDASGRHPLSAPQWEGSEVMWYRE